MQVAFNCYEDEAKKQWVDEGVWLSLNTGNIFLTYNYRPFKAVKYVKEEDSFFHILTSSELYIYPGENNPRVRWEKSGQRELAGVDLKKAQTYAADDYANVIKQVKGQIKNPLSDKNPIFAVKIGEMRAEKEKPDNIVIVDEKGVQIPLRLQKFGSLIKSLSKDQVIGHTAVLRFAQDLKEQVLYAVPLAVINNDDVIRFYY